MDSNITEKQIILNGNLVCYSEAGNRDDNPSVVFIHSFGLNKSLWDSQMDIFRNDYHVIAYDVRGHGNSGIADGHYTIDLFVGDLVALLDHLNLKRVVLCGLSMGGYIALRAIDLYPEKIAGLILCDTKSYADSNAEKSERFALIRHLKENNLDSFSVDMVHRAFCQESFGKRQETVSMVMNWFKANSILGLCGVLLALAARTDTSYTLKNIKAPTLILAGKKDNETTSVESQYLNHFITGSGFHTISDAAHLTNLENPEEFNRLLSGFLKKNVRTFTVEDHSQVTPNAKM